MLTWCGFYAVGYYQPETAYQIFTRSILGQDVATGLVSLNDTPDYASEGPANIFYVKNEPPAPIPSLCNIFAYPLSLYCTQEQVEALINGTAVVANDVVVSPSGGTS
jgi:hypothetical protein